MIKHPNIEAYIEYVREHPEEVNEERKLLIDNIIEPLLQRDDVFFDVVTYENCLKYCESNYWKLFPYQKFIYAFAFMYVDDIPVFSTFFIEMGRGNGKTSGFMPLMNFFQTPLYGVKNYHVDIIANNEDQSKRDFNIVYDMLEGAKSKFKQLFFWSKEIVRNKKTGAELRYNTSNAKTKDGKEGGALLFDEYHAYETYEQIKVFTSQLGKIKHARRFIITTQGYFRGGPLDEMETLCIQVLQSGDNPLGYFPFICKIECREDADNPARWILANPSMPYMPILAHQIRQDFEEMQRLPSMRSEFMTKRMDFPDRDDSVTVASWEDIEAATLDPITREPRPTPALDGRNCVIGIDYADIRDFASAGVLFKIDGEYIWRQHTWICKNSPFFNDIKFPFDRFGEPEFSDFEIVDSVSIPISGIVDWCMEQMAKYSVQKIVMDTYRFGLFRQAFEERGVPIETKKNPYGLVRMIRSVSAINTLTAPLIEKGFVERTINYGLSAIMRWYTNNTAVGINKMGNKYYEKIEPKLRKNDGFMAFVVAMSAENELDEIVIYI